MLYARRLGGMVGNILHFVHYSLSVVETHWFFVCFFTAFTKSFGRGQVVHNLFH